MTLGASKKDWDWWDLVLGFGADLLPVVADPDAPKTAGSKVKKFGKTPSAYDREGNAHGLSKWTERVITDADIARWSADDRLSMCIRSSAVRAIDVDITEPELARKVYDVLYHADSAHSLVGSTRTRANSNKFLVPVLLAGKQSKRIIDCGESGRIEFLADGQQWLVSGTHESGVRYEWPNDLPESVPTITIEQLDAIWSELEQFAVTPARMTGPLAGAAPADGSLLTEISAQQLDDLRDALKFPALLASAADNSVWSEVGYALLSIADGASLFGVFSQAAPNFNPDACNDWWTTHKDQTPRSDFRHVFTLARRLGWRTLADVNAFPVVDSAPGELPPLLPDEAAKPILRLSSGALDHYALQAESILSPEIYVQSGRLVRIGVGGEITDKTLNRTPEQRAVIGVSAEYLRRQLTKLADIQKYDGRMKEWKPIDCPLALTINIMDQKEWPNLRQLEAISRAPFLRNDGSVCEAAGYDTSSGVLYIPNATFPPLPIPSRDEAMHALDRIMEPFDEFPYATDAARSAFLAHILTEVSRVALDSVPMFWYSAPSAGTGKTLLSKMPAMITHGTDTSLRPWVGNDEEVRKVIFASLLAGDRSIGFDNVPNGGKIRSAMLCAMLTAGASYKDRKLGVSEVIAVQNKATCFASGNNITPVSDMARRSLIIRLDADVGSKQLRNRSFSITNLQGYVALNRSRLLVDALTIIRSYLAEPNRIGITPLPSFEKWSQFVREPILWLGLADPVESQEEESDDEQDALTAAFHTLAEKTVIGHGKEFTAKDVIDNAVSIIDGDGSTAALLMAAGCGDPTSSMKMGYWLRGARDKIAGNYKLERRKLYNGIQRWMFKKIATNTNEDLL
jgi:putative DNA primase/helicase